MGKGQQVGIDLTESPIFSLKDVEIYENERGKQMTGKMTIHLSNASKMLDVDPEQIKAFVLVAMVDDPEQNFRIHHFANTTYNRLSVYAMLTPVQKMLIENFKKEINPEGLI